MEELHDGLSPNRRHIAEATLAFRDYANMEAVAKAFEDYIRDLASDQSAAMHFNFLKTVDYVREGQWRQLAVPRYMKVILLANHEIDACMFADGSVYRTTLDGIGEFFFKRTLGLNRTPRVDRFEDALEQLPVKFLEITPVPTTPLKIGRVLRSVQAEQLMLQLPAL